MVWGGISIEGRMDLAIVRINLTTAEYIEQILVILVHAMVFHDRYKVLLQEHELDT